MCIKEAPSNRVVRLVFSRDKDQERYHEDYAANDRDRINGAGKANIRLHLAGEGRNGRTNGTENKQHQCFPNFKGERQQKIESCGQDCCDGKANRQHPDNSGNLRFVCGKPKTDAQHQHGGKRIGIGNDPCKGCDRFRDLYTCQAKSRHNKIEDERNRF